MKLNIFLTPSQAWEDVLRIAEHTEREHAAYGIHFGSTGQRLDRLEEACQDIRDRVTFHGQHYQLEGASMHPKPAGRFPLLVGGGGERRTIPIAARYADEWNVWATVETFAHKARILERACERAGRDPRDLRRSTQALLALRAAGLPRRPFPTQLAGDLAPRAISTMGREASITILAASSLNSGVYFLRRSGIYPFSFRNGPYRVFCPESGRRQVGSRLGAAEPSRSVARTRP